MNRDILFHVQNKVIELQNIYFNQAPVNILTCDLEDLGFQVNDIKNAIVYLINKNIIEYVDNKDYLRIVM